jgi:hypothetical protein
MARTITPVVAAPPRLSRWFGSCRGALIKGPSSLPSSGLPAPSEAPGLLPQRTAALLVALPPSSSTKMSTNGVDRTIAPTR